MFSGIHVSHFHSQILTEVKKKTNLIIIGAFCSLSRGYLKAYVEVEVVSTKPNSH